MDDQNSGAVLYRARILAASGELLDQVGSLSGAGGRSAEKKHSCLLLAYRPGERHPLAAEHRTEFPMVLHRASRARPRLLLHSLYAPGGSVSPAHRREPRIPRRDWRTDLARLEPGPYLASRAASFRPISRPTRPRSCSMTRWRARFRLCFSPPA